jgi:hypothetical protein
MFYGFESDNHLFKKELQARAISRDVNFFRTLMKEVTE